MGAEIDRLDIQVEAEATKANQQLSNMAKYLESVAGSLMKINGSSGVIALSTISSNLAASAAQLSQVKASDFKKISSGLTAFANVNSGGLWNTANAVKGLANNLSGIDGIHFDASGLDGLVNALSKLGSKSSGLGTENLIKIKDDLARFVQSMNDIGAVNFDISGMGMAGLIHSISSMGGEKVTQATKNLPALSVYLRKLVNEMNGIGKVSFDTAGLAELVKALSALGGKGATQAIKNLPSLSTELSKFIDVLSKVPDVSRNTIKLMNVLVDLASQGNKVGTAAHLTANAFGVQGKSAQIAASRIQNLSSALVILQQAYRLISRAAKKLYSFTTSSMDFLETVNYFEVAMRKIGDSAASQWKENGYESAEAYAESFAERSKQLTEKMTGYAIDADGNASYTGIKNLGMDPDKVLQYQATFAQISSSIGVAEESALNFSKALTMLGADWASLRNLSFEQGWEKFASALAGQSRAVRSLGIDITNATLQEYAYNYGLDQAISKMNQATKAQLRLLAILDQSKVAYGDLANTIQSPANQIRMLQQNVSNLGRVFGNLFLPILQKVLPYINGVTIAVQRLFTWVGSLIGIKFDSVNSSMGGMSDEMYDLVDGSEDLTTGLGNADKAAKKLNKTLQGWHEINNITTKEDSGTGSGSVGYGGGSPILDDEITKALADYEKAWNDAFSRMENKAQTIADKLGKYLEPVKKIIQDFAIGDYFQAGKDTSALVVGIFNFIADAIKKVNWYKIGKNIGDFIAGIDWLKILKAVGRVFSNALNAAFELWVGALSAAPLETILATVLLLPNALKAIATSKIIKGIEALCSKFMGLGNHVKSFAKVVGEKGVLGGLHSLSTGLSGVQKGVIGVTAVFAEFALVSNGVKNLTSETGNLAAGLAELAVGIIGAGAAFTLLFGQAGLVATVLVGAVAAVKGLCDAFEETENIRFAESVRNAFTGNGGTPIDELIKSTTDSITALGNGLDSVEEKSQSFEIAKQRVEDINSEIARIKILMDEGVMSVEEGSEILKTKFDELATAIDTKLNAALDVVLAGFGEGGALSRAWEATGESADELKRQTVESMSEIQKESYNLTEQLKDIPYGTDRWNEVYGKLVQLYNGMDETDKAAQSLASQITDKLDWNGYINTESGVVNTEQISSALQEMGTAADDVGKRFKDGFDNVKNALIDAGNSEGAKTLEDRYDQMFDHLNTESAQEITKFTDAIQNDLISNVTTIIENAQTDWEKLGGLEKTLRYNGDIDNFVRERVTKYKTDMVDPISNEIQTTLGELGVNGAGWSSGAMNMIVNSLFTTDKDLTNGLVGTVRTDLATDWENIINGVKEDTKDLGGKLVAGILEGEKNVSKSEYTDAAKAVIGSESSIGNASIIGALKGVGGIHSPADSTMFVGKNLVLGIFEGFKEVDFKSMMNAWWKDNVEPWFKLERWTEFGKNMKTGLTNEWNAFVTFYKSSEIWNFITEKYSINTWTTYGANMKDSLITKWNEFTNEFRIDSIWEFIRGQFSKESWTFGGISEGLQGSFEAAWNTVKAGWSGFADWFEKHMTFKIDTNTAYGKELSKLFGGATEVQMIKLPRYSTGGFPEDGLFMANHGELVGEFANGKTAVANNDQITAGIEEAAYRGVSRALAERGDSNVTFKVEGDPNGLFKVVKKQSSDYTKRTGRPAFG